MNGNTSTTKTQLQVTSSPPICISDDFTGYPIDSFCLQHVPAEDLESVLVPGGLVKDRIERMGLDIARDLANEEFHALCVLRGGYQFFNDLLEVIRRFHRLNPDQSALELKSRRTRRIHVEFIRLKSYEDDSSGGDVKIMGIENLKSLKGKNVLIVEDIIDTGLTMGTLLKVLAKEEPKTVRVASLFYKRTEKNVTNYRPHYIGIEVPDLFIVGCNLDYNDYFRDLQHVCVISQTGKNKYRKSGKGDETN
ncbi:Hypoxanthine-guanine phosphoribosyltransferase [Fragariocoptes setiger]|uniref:Hypoxanthine phosphoribosyltransferase n=1 Tax=Fragariocoptes setiger TaxID=1670756 RepID=A0ABQ7S9C4_9ACAR|nr:Hypoxanthine-guanine phosphoribosyltransferase [Fragariocoptes setiger]